MDILDGMSFLRDFGSIAWEFLDVKDDITKSVTDVASRAVSSTSAIKDDIVQGAKTTFDQIGIDHTK